jgi:hypothetical protein
LACRIELLVGLSLLVAQAAATWHPDAAAAEPGASVLAILTPAIPSQIAFRHPPAIVNSLPIMFPELAVAEALTTPMSKADAGNSRRLSARARSDGYSPAATLSRALVAAAQVAGRSAVEATAQRSTRGGPGPIKRDELPDPSPAPVLLDVSVTELGLVGGWGAKFYPRVAATFRLIDAQGGLIRPSHPLASFYRAPDAAGCPTGHGLVCLEPDPGCVFAGMAEVEATAPRVWSCLDKILVALAAQIVAGLPSR